MKCQQVLLCIVRSQEPKIFNTCMYAGTCLSSIASVKCSQGFGMSLPPGMPLHNYSVRGLLRWQCQMVARTSSGVDSALDNAFWIQGGDITLHSSSRPAFWYRLRGANWRSGGGGGAKEGWNRNYWHLCIAQDYEYNQIRNLHKVKEINLSCEGATKCLFTKMLDRLWLNFAEFLSIKFNRYPLLATKQIWSLI
jgi:hypothetical protein